jgi:hypothetical protein
MMMIALSLAASAGQFAIAAPIPQGQAAAPPALVSRSALPDCGFAATESWGPNGFQYCDPRNVYPSANFYGAGGHQHR